MTKRHLWGSVALVLAIGLMPVIHASAPAAAAVGGVNTGLPGSTCAATNGGLPYTAPGAGVSTTALGTAPAYYELGQPAGAFAGLTSKGVMVVIHGGGWYLTGRAVAASERPFADVWRNRGWTTLNITYRACAQSVPDVLWFHDAIRQIVGPTTPVCATGRSAGGHLALMMASARPDVSCVISEAGPTDLAGLALGKAYNPVTKQLDAVGPTRIFNMAVAAFGLTQLAAMSPILHVGSARLLLATAQQDAAIPLAQGHALLAAVRVLDPTAYVDVVDLPFGSPLVGFTHTKPPGTGVSRGAYDDYLVRQLKAVAPLVAPTGITTAVINELRLANPSSTLGVEELDITVLATQATAVVGGRVLLPVGQVFKMQSCAAYYPPTGAPKATCAQALVNTQLNAAAVGAALPSVNAAWARPAAGSASAFAYGFANVWSLDAASRWVLVASSMPDKSVDAGVYVPAAGT